MIEWVDLLSCAWREGSEDPSTGYLDCLGVVKTIFARGGVKFSLPGDWIEVEDLRELRPLDVVATMDPKAEKTHRRTVRVAGERISVCVAHVGCSVGYGRSATVVSAGLSGVFSSPAHRMRNRVGIYRAQS